MKRDTLLGRLEAWVQEEAGAQMRLLELLRRQRAALCASRRDGVEKAALAVEATMAERDARDRRRDDLIGAFARHFDVDPAALTVGSIAERLGDNGVRLAQMRAQLRTKTIEVQREGRIVAVLVRQNRALLREVIECVVGTAEAGVSDDGARILDARA